jgi:two-component system, chemotaxis family, chemotaxis protein CheY
MTRKEILIVDDSESIRELVANTLIEAGYIVHKAINGIDALKKLEVLPEGPDMILSDLNMPEMDGLMLVTEVRKMEKYKYLPIIILTTESEVQKKLLAKEAGATGWIVKPFERDKLIKVINKVIN